MHSLAALFRRRAGTEAVAPLAQVNTTATVGETVAAMAAAEASAALVVDGAGRPLGIVTEQDVARRIAFALPPEASVTRVMTAPVETVRADDYLFHAIARMRRRKLRRLPVVSAEGAILGSLDLHEAFARAVSALAGLVDTLTPEETIPGLAAAKQAQFALAETLLAESLPAPEIMGILADFTRDLHARIAEHTAEGMRADGLGPAPAKFCLIVMGSAGRGESLLHADQDNGFIVDDYPDDAHDAMDAWFVEFAGRMTAGLDAIGIPFCTGYVMATNPLWRKTRTQWRAQMEVWFRQRFGHAARFADIFFDFAPAWGESGFADELRAYTTPRLAAAGPFLRDMADLQKDFSTALRMFGRLAPDPQRPDAINLKTGATLPLISATRLLALRHGVSETGTIARLDALAAAGALGRDEHAALRGALAQVGFVLLRQQVADHAAGRAIGYRVPRQALSRAERAALAESMRTIERLRERVAVEIGGRTI